MSDIEPRKKIIELTLALYRVTDKLPKEEIIKEKIRGKALDFASNFIGWHFFPETEKDWHKNLIVDLEVLKTYFGVVKIQNWVDPVNFDVLEDEYSDVLYKFFLSLSPKNSLKSDETEISQKKFGKRKEIVSSPLKEREVAIVNCFKGNGIMKVGELTNIFSGLSKRTLRRDIEKLCRIGILERTGSFNETAYRLRGNIGQEASLGQQVEDIGQVGTM